MKMKIAVCISGEMRTFDDDLVINGLKYINKLNPDIFISTWKHRGISYNTDSANFSLIDQKIDDKLEDKIYNIYDNIISLEIEDFNEWRSNSSEEIRNLMSSRLSGGQAVTSPPQLYKNYKCNLLKKNYEHLNNFKYDIVIRIRPDSLFVDDFDFNNFSDNMVYHINFGVPGAFWPNRIFDIFFYGSSDVMDIISESYKDITKLISNQFSNGLDSKDPCRILYVQSMINNINVESINSRICHIYRGQGMDQFNRDIDSAGRYKN